MAKQTGPVKIAGTIGNICFYEMDGKHYARLKSSLKGKRVKKDPAFQLTMMYAGWLAKASKIASVVYASLPEKEHRQYRIMTGIAMKMLKAGAAPEDIVDHLAEMYIPAVSEEEAIPELCDTSEERSLPQRCDISKETPLPQLCTTSEEQPTLCVTAAGKLAYIRNTNTHNFPIKKTAPDNRGRLTITYIENTS
jgi:hypothetical protein